MVWAADGGDRSLTTVSETLEDRVLRVISTSRRIPLDAIEPDSTFEQLGIDSLDRLNILFDLESEFNIEINDDEAKKATNIREIMTGIRQLMEASGNPVPSS